MYRLTWPSFLLVTAFTPFAFAQQKTIAPDLSPISDAKVWSVINADCNAAEDNGKSVVRVQPRGLVKKGSNIGLALIEGLEFEEGTLEIDLKGQGKAACFPGIAFNVVDGKNFEAVYFRPFNFGNARAVQYVAWPQHTWEKLRKGKPGVYEAAVKPVPSPNEWFHARIEVTKQKVRVWVEDAREPCLVVDRLAGRERGKVGLFVDSREGVFRELKITQTK